jgi:hypothetical protein
MSKIDDQWQFPTCKRELENRLGSKVDRYPGGNL